jgi:2,4-dienoyl-CoA reductase-like NADH-dependent reductase (Old Yellow Enzyme family)
MIPLKKIASLKTAQQFRDHVASLGIDIPIDEEVFAPSDSPLLQPLQWNQRTIGNRIAVQPMEGWDGTDSGGVTPPMLRRWQRFGESGAKLIWGGEAMAVRPDGRANPHQLILTSENRDGIASLVRALRERHREQWETDDDLVVGFQLTHSGRFCRPNSHHQWEPRVAFRHPLLDARFGVERDDCVLTSEEVFALREDYVRAAHVAQKAGADFVDIKCCHGYLLHEFLSARIRSDAFGGSLENRSRLLFSIIEGIRERLPDLGIGVRLSAFDTVPFEPNPETATEGRLGQGRPRDISQLLPYVWGFGMDVHNPLQIDLAEPLQLIGWLREAGVSLINITAGSPYYTPHLLRPAAFPPSDGYQPHEDPLVSVSKHISATRAIKDSYPDMVVVGSGYSYLQEFLPGVALHTVRSGWTDCVGLGRTVLSYPKILMDAIQRGVSERKLVCRTFSDCTTAPRNGLPSGCYPLDDFYKGTPNAEAVKKLKSGL